MTSRSILCAALLAIAGMFAPYTSRGGEVAVSKLHICCGACVRALDETLGEVDGVKEIEVDREERRVTFNTETRKALDEALKAVTLAGFYGQAQYDGRDIEMPTAPPKKDTTADRATFEGVHLCCKGCAKALTEAVKGHDNVIAVDCDTKNRTVSFVGTEMRLSKLLDALHAAGFHGHLER